MDSSTQPAVTVQQPLIVNKLLGYIAHKHDNSNMKALKSAVFNLFKPETVSIAKELIVNSIDKPELTKWPRPPRRRKDSKDVDGKLKSDVEDLFAIYSFIDKQKLHARLPVFVAVNLDMFPSHSLTEGDASGIMNRLEAVNDKLSNITETLGNNESACVSILEGVHKSISTVSELTVTVNRFDDHGMSLISEQNSNNVVSYVTDMDTSNQILLSE